VGVVKLLGELLDRRETVDAALTLLCNLLTSNEAENNPTYEYNHKKTHNNT
jgi:hypothetical protein